MRAIIPVAGVGSRLRPHTYTLPKVLLNVAGKPILAHILDALLERNITKATIITGYMGDLVEEYVSKNYDMEVEFVQQNELKGLGHAIWCAKNTFGNDDLMIILGDTIFDVDLKLAYESGISSLGVKPVEDPRRFGVVLQNPDGTIKRLVEKPEKPVSHLAIVGIYYITNSDLLISCLEELIEKKIKTKNEYQLTDALQLMIEKGEKFITFPVEGWYDCGKRETMLATNRFLLAKKPTNSKFVDSIVINPSYVAPDAVIERSVIGPYATVASGAKVKDSIIRDSIISDGACVDSCLLQESIIGNNADLKGNFYHLNVGSSSEISLS